MANALIYGFRNLQDHAMTPAVVFGPERLRRAVYQSAAEYNADINRVLNLFCEPIEDPKLRFKSRGNPRLQPGNEYSRAKPVKGATYDVAFPLQKGDHAFGSTQLARFENTVGDMADDLNTAFEADRNWMADHVLGALFYNASGWSFTDPKFGTLTVLGLANGDTTVYGRVGGTPATDTHYLAQAGGIADATNPFPTIYTELMEHPENAGAEIISFVNSSDADEVQALATFRDLEDPTVREADTLSVVTGNPNVAVPGTVIGRAGRQWIVSWDRVPATYIVSVAVGPNVAPPLAMRRHPNPQAQGFGPRGERDDYPYLEQQLWRLAGFGGWNRTGAVVTRTGNASYAIPTNFGSPMA